MRIAGALTSPARDAEVDRAMERYAAGDDAAFAELYGLLAPRLRRMCLRLARRADEAEELFQEVLLRLHKGRSSYGAGKPVFPWLFAIARNAYRDRGRRRAQCPEDLADADDASRLDQAAWDGDDATPESAVMGRDLASFLQRELGRMCEKGRRAFMLLHDEGMSAADASAVLGVSCDAVFQRAHRAREQLQAALRDAGWRTAIEEAPRRAPRLTRRRAPSRSRPPTSWRTTSSPAAR